MPSKYNDIKNPLFVTLLIIVIIGLIITVILVWPLIFNYDKWISALVFSPDNKILASGSADRTIRLWDVATGKQIRKIKGIRHPRQIKFIDNGKTLVSGGWGFPVTFWDATTGVKKFGIPHDSIDTLVISPKEDFIVIGCAGNNTWIYVWDLTPTKIKYAIKGNDKQINRLSISYDGKTFATAGEDNTCRLFNAESGMEIYKFQNRDNVVFSPFSNIVALGSGVPETITLQNKAGEIFNVHSNKPEIIIWDADNQKEISRIYPFMNFDSFAFLPPKGESIITLASLGMQVQIWDIKTGKEISGFVAYTKDPNRVYAISSDGSMLAIGDWLGYIKLWDLKTGKELEVIQ